MQTKNIRIADIEEEKFDGDAPGYIQKKTKDQINKLAASIKNDGLLHPILVRSGNKSGKYRIVVGRSRVQALKSLKEEVVRAQVDLDMGDDEAQAAAWAENLFRGKSFKNADYFTGIQTYEAIRAKINAGSLHPALEGVSIVDPNAPVADPANPTDPGSVTPDAGPAAETKGKPKGVDPSVAKLAEATGQTVEAAYRDTKIAKNLSEEELKALEANQVVYKDKLKLARIKDQAKRSAAVSWVAAGMDVDEAIKQSGAEVARRKSPNAVPEEPVSPEAAAANALEDDAWLERYCKPVREKIADPTAFDSSALFYRRTVDARSVYRKAVSHAVEDMVRATSMGTFGRFVMFVITASHPQHWQLCGTCKGTQVQPGTPEGQPAVACRGCSGDGFKVPREQK